ncbi:MAG: leucyl aminopeptidase [Pseudomonadales bacterium]
MKFKVQQTPAELSTLKSECLIIPVYTDKTFSKAVNKLDKTLQGFLTKVLNDGDFSAESGSFMVLPLAAKVPFGRIALLGCGNSAKYSAKVFRKGAQKMYLGLAEQSFKSAHLVLDEHKVANMAPEQQIQEWTQIGESNDYQYSATLGRKPKKPSFSALTLLGEKSRKAVTAAKTGKAIGEGMNVAKELGNLPGNVCTPRYLGTQAQKMGRKHEKLKVTVLDDKKLEAMRMGSLLSVARGSKEPARLISMEYQGGKASGKPVVLVGKGITFDTGGISLKPGAAMDEMKFDMCGAASVFGVIAALSAMNAKVNVVGLVAAAENMPGSQATKPGDVVTSMSGKTIEVLNTDAEGRLVLCDALSYAARYKPTAVIDIATLTGAVIIALGHHASGLFSNDDDLAAQLLAAGEASGDKAWQFPIWDEYQEQLKSNFADLANIGGRAAGSITAACFLSQFAEDYPWAHIDIAGTAWLSGSKKGATGKPVPLLMNYLLNG